MFIQSKKRLNLKLNLKFLFLTSMICFIFAPEITFSHDAKINVRTEGFGGFVLGEKYSDETGESHSGKLLIQRDLFEYLTAYIHENATYVIWTEGPNKGQIYDYLERIQGKEFTPPNVNEIKKNITMFMDEVDKVRVDKDERNRLHAQMAHLKPSNERYDELEHELRVKLKLYNENESKMFSRMDRLRDYIYGVFEENVYGDYSFRDSVYFNYDNDVNKAIDLYLNISHKGVTRFIHELLIENKIIAPLEKKLIEFSALKGKEIIKNSLYCFHKLSENNSLLEQAMQCVPRIGEQSNLEDNEVISLFKNVEKVLKEEIFSIFSKSPTQTRLNYQNIGVPVDADTVQFFNEEQTVLSHGTYSQKFSQIIALGGLASSDFAKNKDIRKTTGGENGDGDPGPDPHVVSFFDGKMINPGFGHRRAFEYPMTFVASGTDVDDYSYYWSFPAGDYKEQLERNGVKVTRFTLDNLDGIRDGAMRNEKVVMGHVPLDAITFIFVPPFAVENVQRQLNQHGFKHIKVVPFNIFRTKYLF